MVSTPSTFFRFRVRAKHIPQLHRELLHGKTSTDALIEYLTSNHIKYDAKTDWVDNRVLQLFIAFPASLEIARTNPDIMILDCTYKTDRWDIPSLHIVGKYYWHLIYLF
ncbi:hypothetical protein V1505DRAFT_191165 [Lipomyces doorenjongii]